MDKLCVPKRQAATKGYFRSHRKVHNLKRCNSIGELFFLNLFTFFWLWRCFSGTSHFTSLSFFDDKPHLQPNEAN